MTLPGNSEHSYNSKMASKSQSSVDPEDEDSFSLSFQGKKSSQLFSWLISPEICSTWVTAPHSLDGYSRIFNKTAAPFHKKGNI